MKVNWVVAAVVSLLVHCCIIDTVDQLHQRSPDAVVATSIILAVVGRFMVGVVKFVVSIAGHLGRIQ